MIGALMALLGWWVWPALLLLGAALSLAHPVLLLAPLAWGFGPLLLAWWRGRSCGPWLTD